ncbi:Katanin p60 ATPase-containing subunit A-like 2 [Geranomyces variabilis]|uniref:Katanin p60 ATPase-containing subunit A-like 2 n=1 Tax=Geranomyces variabilis TaxID=109894 RepID=A0AAD5XSA8_9FUNG|nr:Katanin p60 ATPase-containing subunit A-like 2 [Geranomyces variabilis]
MMQGSEINLTHLKVSSEARLAEESRVQLRQRNLMVLILGHLESFGYIESVEKLQAESNVSLQKVQVADNVDLLNILQEYESYYAIKFGKAPKLTRKAAGNSADGKATRRPAGSTSGPSYGHKLADGEDTLESTGLARLSGVGRVSRVARNPAKPVADDPKARVEKPRSTSAGKRDSNVTKVGGIVGTKVTEKQASVPPPVAVPAESNDAAESLYDGRLMKPMPDYGNFEFRELAAIISRDIFVTNPNVRWKDIAGLSRSKRLVKEAVVYPLKFPDLFSGILSPWKGLLLYGPPGTGKTMLAKAVATECNTTFFNISASSIVSKWRGDSEKLVRVLFELARYHAPSTIFLDELESIMSHRTSDGAEHEGSRRMKTELLIQLDGLSKTNDHVFLLAASNLPWDLDMAMLRRLEKRILIDVPDAPARHAMFEAHLPESTEEAPAALPVGKLDYEHLASITDGYSGSDIKLVCKEAAMRPIRKFFDLLDTDEDISVNKQIITQAQRAPVSQADVEAAIASTRPSSSNALGEKYRQWQADFGSA